jgi:LmbE family N-acetylglucosaminyl deacetylase
MPMLTVRAILVSTLAYCCSNNLVSIFQSSRLTNLKPKLNNRPRSFARVLFAAALAFFLSFTTNAQRLPPLPQDSGTAGLKQMLLRLQTTARLLQIDAHPDDEDGGMLTYESRGKGVTVTLLTLNRGEGGQNKLGSDFSDVLGVLRTLEVTAADQYYGINQRFTRVADFGFSKSPDETFQKWRGHDVPLADIVRVIRTFRPDVLVARFSGTSRDGHGHHQASALLTMEAYKASADPNRFPEQIKEGLLPWQAKKLYIGNVCGFFAPTCADENWTVKLNIGEYDPALGMSFAQFAMEGLRHQLSQGAGGWSMPSGPRYSYYKLVNSTLPQADQKKHENNFFDDIDTSLPGLASRLGAEESNVPFFRPSLTELQNIITQASQASSPSSEASPLLEGLAIVDKLISQISDSKLSASEKEELVPSLKTKQTQLEEAANLAAGVNLNAFVDVPVAPSANEAVTAVPGHNLNVTVQFSSVSKSDIKDIALNLPSGWTATKIRHDGDSATFRITVPENAQLTRPYWHRNDPQVESVNTIDEPQYATLPLAPPQINAHATYSIAGKTGIVHTTVMVKYQGSNGERTMPLAVTPVFSVLLNPSEQVLSTKGSPSSNVTVRINSSVANAPAGTLHLEVPSGWRAEPASQKVEHLVRDKNQDFVFQVFPADHKPGRTEIRAVLEANGKKYSEGYTLVTRVDLASAYYYQPAIQRVSMVDVKVPRDLKVGYVMGAGDDIATVLKQVGMDVTMIPADKLSSEDLSQFGTIVLGIRAYDTQKDVADNNKKLLDYVSKGGTLVVQYNAGTGDFNSGRFTPYPAELSRNRVSVEEVPVEILAPDDSIFHYPNEITQSDFNGWVQERGLNFMDQWDDHFKALLACNDPGESPQKGGLLRTQYGKGTYIYTGYSFFRQLPAGVPGAVRLFVNIVSAGHTDK